MIRLRIILYTLMILKSCAEEAPFSNNGSSSATESSLRDIGVRHRSKDKPSLLHLLGDPNLSSPAGKGPHCFRKAKCEHMNNTTCLGAKLPYSSTTLDLVGMTPEQMQEKLQFWTALKHVPRCWAVIQPFLCALYMPRCEDDKVELPPQELCKMALSACRILELERGWTSPLRCDDPSRFPPNCTSDAREVRFNTTAECLPPLVPTDSPSAFYEGTEGCGMQCANPMFTSDEHHQIQGMIAWAGGLCAAVNLFTVITFLIDWRSANKYPALIIFYINCCFLMVCVGFLAQFLPGAREGIVCRKDGTLRMSEPSAGENLSCVVVFVLIYYSLMAACVWFVILAYAWHLSFQALGKIQDRIDKKGAYFHLVAWSLPLVLTITTMAVGEIDANSELGVCFVGYMNPAARGGLLLGPVALLFSAGAYFLLRGLFTLIKVKINSNEIISERASAKIRETIVRMGFFTLFTFIFVVATFVVHIYEFQHRRSWKESFRTYIICKIMRSGGVLTDGVGLTGHGDCRMEVRPSLAMVQLHLLALFTAGVVMSSWVWTSSTVDTWLRFLKRILNQEEEKPAKFKKHKVIAQVFAKRQVFNRAGRISISFHSTHDDPVGLNFELNSVASQDMSNTWAAALPKLVTRRGALIGPATGSISSQYSDFSVGARRVYPESRRQSIDSQLSAALSELTASRKAGSTPVPVLPSLGVSGGRVKSRTKRKKHQGKRCRIGLYSRRGSTTSQESQLGAQILSTLAMGNPNMPSLVPNLKRRTGNAGLNDDQLLPKAFTRGTFGFPDPSDVTDDDGPESLIVKGLSFDKREELEGAMGLTDLNSPQQLKLEISKAPIKDENDSVTKGGGSRSCMSNNRHGSDHNTRSPNSSLDSNHSRPASQERNKGTESFERNGGRRRQVRKPREKPRDEENGKLLSSMEAKHEGTVETRVNHGKTYNKLETNSPGRLTSNNHDESCSSDDDCETTNVLILPKKNSHHNSNETPDKNKSVMINLEQGDSSDGSSTSYCQEISCLGLKSSLSGISSGPSKHVVVSNLKLAREVGTQTSLSSGLNEIENIENERSRLTQASHQLISNVTRSENNYQDITSVVIT